MGGSEKVQKCANVHRNKKLCKARNGTRGTSDPTIVRISHRKRSKYIFVN